MRARGVRIPCLPAPNTMLLIVKNIPQYQTLDICKGQNLVCPWLAGVRPTCPVQLRDQLFVRVGSRQGTWHGRFELQKGELGGYIYSRPEAGNWQLKRRCQNPFLNVHVRICSPRVFASNYTPSASFVRITNLSPLELFSP